jgi:hypothetical protein
MEVEKKKSLPPSFYFILFYDYNKKNERHDRGSSPGAFLLSLFWGGGHAARFFHMRLLKNRKAKEQPWEK